MPFDHGAGGSSREAARLSEAFFLVDYTPVNTALRAVRVGDFSEDKDGAEAPIVRSRMLAASAPPLRRASAGQPSGRPDSACLPKAYQPPPLYQPAATATAPLEISPRLKCADALFRSARIAKRRKSAPAPAWSLEPAARIGGVRAHRVDPHEQSPRYRIAHRPAGAYPRRGHHREAPRIASGH